MAVPQIECVFFDLDDSLYQNGWATMDKITARVGEYCNGVLGLPSGKDYQLYKTYGTTICGLVREGLLDESRTDDFLRFAHDVPLEDVRPSPGLREVLQAIPHQRWVFTASIRQHAERCLKRLGIEDLFLGIISASSREMVERVGYVSKHDPRCFAAAMELAGVPRERAAGCMLLDDSASNLRTAKELGWHTVLVGLEARDGSRIRCPHADAAVASLVELRGAMPKLFASPDARNARTALDRKRSRNQEASSPCLDMGSVSDTESTSAGEDLESMPSHNIKVGAKRRCLPLPSALGGTPKVEDSSSSRSSLRRALHQYPSDSTDSSYEGLSAAEDMAGSASSP